MKQKSGFTLRHICGEYVLVASGRNNIDFSSIISLNESAAYLWEQLEGKEFDAELMAQLLTNEYEVDEVTALADSKTLIEKWLEAGIIE